MNANRIIVIAFGLSFAALGFGSWVAPQEIARLFAMEAIGVAGLVAVRAELGGLFVGLAALCLAGAIGRRPSLLSAAAVAIAAVAVGRLVGIVAGGDGGAQMLSLAIEGAAIAALIVCARRLRTVAPPVRRALPRLVVAAGLLVTVLLSTAVVLFDARVELEVFRRAAAAMTGRTNAQLLADDAMRVAICGSSAPLPSADRGKACAAVFAGGKIYVVDIGPESVENLVQWSVPLGQIGGVLLTHFHSDHIGDLGELNLQSWAQGRPLPLRVFGGPGVERVVNGFNEAYRLDQGYRTAHHTPRIMPAEAWGLEAHPVDLDGLATPEKSRTGVVLEENGVRITAIEVDHAPITPAYAYRFDYKGRSVVVSGDLKFHAPLVDAARNADVLVIEAISRPMVQALQDAATAATRDRTATIMHDIQDYHIDPAEASEIANRAGVKLLAFYHLLPAPDTFLARRLFAHDVHRVRQGDWTIADDGSLYTLPIGSTDVRIGQVAR